MTISTSCQLDSLASCQLRDLLAAGWCLLSFTVIVKRLFFNVRLTVLLTAISWRDSNYLQWSCSNLWQKKEADGCLFVSVGILIVCCPVRRFFKMRSLNKCWKRLLTFIMTSFSIQVMKKTLINIFYFIPNFASNTWLSQSTIKMTIKTVYSLKLFQFLLSIKYLFVLCHNFWDVRRP